MPRFPKVSVYDSDLQKKVQHLKVEFYVGEGVSCGTLPAFPTLFTNPMFCGLMTVPGLKFVLAELATGGKLDFPARHACKVCRQAGAIIVADTEMLSGTLHDLFGPPSTKAPAPTVRILYDSHPEPAVCFLPAALPGVGWKGAVRVPLKEALDNVDNLLSENDLREFV